MRDYLSEIDGRFPVRNSVGQKERFRGYALDEAAKLGLSRAVREENEGHVNLVFSDPSSARVIFTAHYDTPRRSLLPNLMLVSNQVLYWAYNLCIVLIILAAAIGAAFGAKELFRLDMSQLAARMLMLAVYAVVYFGLFFLMLKGPANEHNRNDNTSGTAAVLELMRTLGERPDVAFILFDDEEKGKKGSKAYAKAHPAIRQNTLIINLDCVGNGDTYVFCASGKAEGNPLYAELQTFIRQSGLHARFYRAHRAQMNSDHKSFRQGVGVCACRYKKLVGYYTGRIHTARDTVAEPETVSRLASALAAFAQQQADCSPQF